MDNKVYFLSIDEKEKDEIIARKLKKIIKKYDIFSFIKNKDMIGIKTHFGEKNSNGFIRPVYLKEIGKIIKSKKALPFITETQTLYVGERSNAIDHMNLAYEHGFTYQNTEIPIIMSDGLLGDQEIEVEIKGKIYNKVNVALLISKCQGLVVTSHFTGHIGSGFGAALKNIGMGCASRRGKLEQHSTAKPNIKQSECTGCKECIKWCPQEAISFFEEKAVIDKQKCIGCGECLAVCRFGAVGFNWKATYEDLQKKIVEHAMGVYNAKKNKIIFINFLNRITKDCDCMGKYEKIVPDIGILISEDPVAIDAASIDIIESKSGKKLSELAYDIPYKVQIDYARELNFGNKDYELIKV